MLSSKKAGDVTNDAWKEALVTARKELGDKEFAKLSGNHTYESCTNTLVAGQAQMVKKWAKFEAVMGPTLNVLRAFDRAISTAVSSNPEVAALVWGSVQALLMISSKFTSCLSSIGSMLEAVTKEMPRFEEYMSCFPSHERLRLRLIDVYVVFITFCARALRFLMANKRMLWAQMIMRSFDSSFEQSLNALRESTARLEKEARAADVKEGFDREQAAKQRHQEVMRRLPIVPLTAAVVRKNIHVPFRPYDRFEGRETELQNMHSFLDPNSTIERTLRVLVIRGLGGSGKTQLALKYTSESLKSQDEAYKVIYWFRAENPTILQQDVAMLGSTLDPDSSASPNQLKSIQVAKEFMSTTTEQYLVIFDNVDNVDDIREYWPNSGTGSILITTRDRDVADALSKTQIELRGLDTDEGLSLLNSHIDPVTSHQSSLAEDVARRIVNELGGLPLAICQMGSYIHQTNCRLEELLENLQRRARSHRLYSDDLSAKPLPYSNTLATCCDLSINLLTPKEKHLLSIIAFFQTDEVEEVLITEGSRRVPELHDISQKMDWNDIIRNLARHGLVTRYQKPTGATLFMHRVIKSHTLDLLDEGDEPTHSKAFTNAVSLLHQMFPSRPIDGGTMTKHYPECERWLPHVLSLRNALQSSGRQLQSLPWVYADLLSSCSHYMYERGPKEALEFITQAVNTCEIILGPEPTDSLFSDICTYLGVLKMVNYSTRGECIAVFQRALQVCQRQRVEFAGPPSETDEIRLANMLNNVGIGHLSLEEYGKALIMFEKSMDIKTRVLDEQRSPYMLSICLYNICRVDEGQNRLPQALSKSRKALELAEAENGPEDFRVNQFRFTYADLLVATGDLEFGLATHEQTLVIRKRVMGDEHNDTAVSYYGLSVVNQHMGRLEKAIYFIDLAIDIFSKVPDAQDRLARSYYRKYLILLVTGNTATAEVALLTAQKLRSMLTGQRSQDAHSIAQYDSLVAYYNK